MGIFLYPGFLNNVENFARLNYNRFAQKTLLSTPLKSRLDNYLSHLLQISLSPT